ncbi:MAG TPA: hypothetical protein VMX75_12815, partial [Spirochaetia bacterium]|nr:hypothetical protein [Spirochaetia bacterium]
DMQEVERLLRQSLEWKMKAELAEIRRRVEIRKIFGEQRWEKFILALKHRRENREEKNPDPDRRTPSVPKANPKQ